MSRDLPILTHYCKRFSILRSILTHGFVAIPNSREVLPYLIDPANLPRVDGASSYGMICFTDIPPEHATEHRKTFGRYGLVPTRDWLNKHSVEQVIYVGESGELSLYFKELFRRGIHDLHSEWIRLKGHTTEPFTVCMTTFGQNNLSHFATTSYDPEYGAIAWTAPAFQLACRFYAYMEADGHRPEREWRIVQTTNRAYEHNDKKLQVKEALSAPHKGGWAAQLEKGFEGEIGRILPVTPKDTACLILPPPCRGGDAMTRYRALLPVAFRDVLIHIL